MAGKYDDILDLLRLFDACIGHPHCDSIQAKALHELKKLNKATKKVLEEDLKKEKEEEEAAAAERAAEEKALHEKEAAAAEAGKTSEEDAKAKREYA